MISNAPLQYQRPSYVDAYLPVASMYLNLYKLYSVIKVILVFNMDIAKVLRVGN